MNCFGVRCAVMKIRGGRGSARHLGVATVMLAAFLIELPNSNAWFVQAGLAAPSSEAPGVVQQGTGSHVDWPSYAGDLRNHHYSALEQVAATNFNSLEIAWRFKTDSLGPRPEFTLEGTPLAVNGVLFTPGGTRRAVVALDATTGEMLWMHSEHEGARAAASPRQLSGRGVAYWSDGF